MFTSNPTRHLDSDVESAHRPSKPKGRVPLVLTAVGLGFVMASLTVSAGRMAYESSGAPALGSQDIDDELSTSRTPEQKATDRAAAVLHAVTGPGEVSGRKISGHTRSSFISALTRAGLTAAEAAAVLDKGVLPASLRKEMHAFEKAGYALASHGGGKTLNTAILSALHDLNSHARKTVTLADDDHSYSAGDSVQPGREGAAGQRHNAIVVTPDCGAATETSQGDQRAFNSAAIPEAEDDFDYGDALGDLVGALNPFQSWSRSAFRVYSTVTPSFSEATGEVKVTVTTETKQGVTITTEITKPVESEIPTLVTQATDTRTGEALTEPITAQAPSVETVSAVAFGQLAQGYYEAKTEQKEQRDEPAAENKRAVDTPPVDAEAQEPQAPVSGQPEAPVAEAPGAPAEGAEEGSEAGDGLPSEPLGDLPQHAAA
ncbi:hypothetical protein [Streptomyces sp. NPDC091040]|uniref:hypothetical protein n=1 Tax=Streptomyces sp. NPDC091040 TaxID=3365972 RepID=UPI00380B3941